MKRILVASMHHESNSFSPIVAGRDDFHVLHGAEVFQQLDHHSSLSGVIRTLQDQGYEVVPTAFASAVPNGQVDRGFYLELKAEILRAAREAQAEAPIDAITLALHGSMYIQGLGDAEGYLLEELRELFPHTPSSAPWTCTPP